MKVSVKFLNKPNRRGYALLYLRISHSSKNAYVSLETTIKPEYLTADGTISSKMPGSAQINKQIADAKLKLEEIAQELKKKHGVFTAFQVKDEYEGGDVSFFQMASDYLEKNINKTIKENTADAYGFAVAMYFQYCSKSVTVKEHTQAVFETAIKTMNNEKGSKTAHQYATIIKSLYIKCGGNNPLKIPIPKPTQKVKQPITIEDVKKLDAIYKSNVYTDRKQLSLKIFLLCAYTGQRFTDVVAMHTSQFIDNPKFSRKVWQFKMTKSRIGKDKIVMVPLLDYAMSIIGTTAGHVFDPKEEITLNSVNRDIKAIAAEHGIYGTDGEGFSMKVTSHVGRHTFGFLLAEAGISREIIQQLLGHETTKMTDRYIHLANSPQLLHTAIEKMETFHHMKGPDTHSMPENVAATLTETKRRMRAVWLQSNLTLVELSARMKSWVPSSISRVLNVNDTPPPSFEFICIFCEVFKIPLSSLLEGLPYTTPPKAVTQPAATSSASTSVAGESSADT